jgi:hypothetical protein
MFFNAIVLVHGNTFQFHLAFLQKRAVRRAGASELLSIPLRFARFPEHLPHPRRMRANLHSLDTGTERARALAPLSAVVLLPQVIERPRCLLRGGVHVEEDVGHLEINGLVRRRGVHQRDDLRAAEHS